MTEKCTFFTFTHVRQTCFAYNFFLVHFFTTFSTDLKSAWNSAFFDTFFDYFKKINFFGHISTFFKLWSQTRKKRLKKSKNLFSKCVLDFNFVPIKESVFFIFKKKVKFVVPQWWCVHTVQYHLLKIPDHPPTGSGGHCRLTFISMTKDEKGLAFFKGLLL